MSSNVDVEIVNFVCTGWLGTTTLDLSTIARTMWNIEYNPQRFSAAIIRIRQGQCSGSATILLFRTGRFVCTGNRSFNEAKRVSRKLARRIQQLHQHQQQQIRFLDFKVQNVVGCLRTGFQIDLRALYEHRREQCLWQQERFPAGIRFRPYNDCKRCALVFPAGRCVLTGCHSHTECMEFGAEVRRLLLRYKCK